MGSPNGPLLNEPTHVHIKRGHRIGHTHGVDCVRHSVVLIAIAARLVLRRMRLGKGLDVSCYLNPGDLSFKKVLGHLDTFDIVQMALP